MCLCAALTIIIFPPTSPWLSICPTFIYALAFFKILISLAIHYSTEVSYVPFHVPLNMTKLSKNEYKPQFQIDDIFFLLLYITLAENGVSLIVFVNQVTLDNICFLMIILCKHILKSLPLLVSLFLTNIFYSSLLFLVNLHHLPFELTATWLTILLLLSGDVHPNPGPVSNDEFSTGFLSFCNWNLNSLATNDFNRITLLNAENAIRKYDIISLCETSLNSDTVVPTNAIPGYTFLPLNHPSDERHGGVGIFYKESLPLRERKDLSFDECLVCELRFGRKKIFFTVLYRNPCHKASSLQFQSFLDNFENLHRNIMNENPYVTFFTGDLNGHSQAWYADGDTNAEGTALNDLFSNLDLHQLIDEPTHFFNDHSNPSCIDLILTDQPNLVTESGVRPSLDPVVRHQMTYCKLNFKIPPPPKYDRKVWHFKKAQSELIKRAISEFHWEQELKKLTDPSQQVELLNNSILNIMSNFIPNEIKRYRPSEPAWFTDSIRQRLKKQNKLYRKFKYKGYLASDKKILDDYRSVTAELIESSKKKFLVDQGIRLTDQSSSQKTYWKIINQFLNKAKIPKIPPLFHNNNFIVCCKEKAQIFNEYFAKQCTPFDTPSSLPQIRYHTNDRLSHFNISVLEIKDLLKTLKPDKAHGNDDISVKMIKLCGDEICLPLLIIFRNILHTGIYPSQWKLANVTPVHKKKDKQTVGNYRPISLLPIFDKIFERIVFKNLYNFLIKNDLITKHQSGFRPGDSCGNQLLSLSHEIHNAFHNKNCLEVRSVFLDMSKAFDKVWHEGLLFKLRQNGVDGKLLTMFSSYLSDRKQRVVLNGMTSDWAPLQSGVPQGSVLGPLLFLIFVNDLEDGIKSQIKFFADDTSLFSIVHDPLISASELNHDLAIINEWAKQWKMSFNPDPTKPAEEILFSVKRKSPTHPPLFFNGIEVKRVPSHKHLGLTFDPQLNFNVHIAEITATARQGVGLIKHLRPYLPVFSLDQIYKMRVRTHFDYCDYIFHIPALKNNYSHDINLNHLMNSLESIQYQAALAITGTWKGTSRDKIYEQLGWESLHNRREFRRLTQFYKIMNNLTPPYLKEPIPDPLLHLFGPRSTNVLPSILCRNQRFKDSFYPDAIEKWNDIGVEFRSIEKLSAFKTAYLNLIRPPKKDIFNIHNPDGIKRIYQLRVGLSPLLSHKNKHNFKDTPSPSCSCGNSNEDVSHFLLFCPFFSDARNILFSNISKLVPNFTLLDPESQIQCLLYGYFGLTDTQNKMIIEESIMFIDKSGRFSYNDDTV